MKLIDIGFRDWEKLPVCKYCGEKLYKGQIDFCNDRCNAIENTGNLKLLSYVL